MHLAQIYTMLQKDDYRCLDIGDGYTIVRAYGLVWIAEDQHGNTRYLRTDEVVAITSAKLQARIDELQEVSQAREAMILKLTETITHIHWDLENIDWACLHPNNVAAVKELSDKDLLEMWSSIDVRNENI